MAFCSNCGAQVPDNAVFCQSCGTKRDVLPHTPEAPAPQVQQTVTPTPRVQHTPRTSPSTSPAIGALKRVASSPWMLISAIAYSLSILMSIIVSTVSASYSVDAFAGFLEELAWSMDVYELYEFSDLMNEYLYSGAASGFAGVSGFLSAVWSAIPQILMALGLWLIYANGRSKKLSFGTGGVTLIKVLNTINLVCSWIGAVALAVTLLIASIFAIAAEAPIEAIIVLVVTLLLSAAVFAACIIYYTKINKSLNAVKNVATTGVADPNASRFVGVMCWIGAAATLLAQLVFLIVMLALMSELGLGVFFVVPNALGAMATAASMVGFGVLIFTYRSQMKLAQMQPMNMIL